MAFVLHFFLPSSVVAVFSPGPCGSTFIVIVSRCEFGAKLHVCNVRNVWGSSSETEWMESRRISSELVQKS